MIFFKKKLQQQEKLHHYLFQKLHLKKKFGPIAQSTYTHDYLQPKTGPPNPKSISDSETEKEKQKKKIPTATVFPFASPGHLPRLCAYAVVSIQLQLVSSSFPSPNHQKPRPNLPHRSQLTPPRAAFQPDSSCPLSSRARPIQWPPPPPLPPASNPVSLLALSPPSPARSTTLRSLPPRDLRVEGWTGDPRARPYIWISSSRSIGPRSLLGSRPLPH